MKDNRGVSILKESVSLDDLHDGFQRQLSVYYETDITGIPSDGHLKHIIQIDRLV